MKNIHRLACAGLLSSSLVAATEQQVVVIGHSITVMSADDVQSIYVGEKQISGGTRLVPVDNSSAQDAFLARYVGMDATKYRAAWTKKAFRDGLTAPTLRSSDAEVVDFVKRTPGAVGYVRAPAPAGVVVVAQ